MNRRRFSCNHNSWVNGRCDWIPKDPKGRSLGAIATIIETRCLGHEANLKSMDSVHSTKGSAWLCVVKILFRSHFLLAKWVDLMSTTFWIDFIATNGLYGISCRCSHSAIATTTSQSYPCEEGFRPSKNSKTPIELTVPSHPRNERR